MNHLNKQLEVNHHALEHYLAEQDRKEQLRNKLDGLGLGLMIFCGLIGLFYTVSNADAIFNRDQKVVTSSLGLTNSIKPNSKPSGAAIVPVSTKEQNKEATSVKVVNIEGKTQVGKTLNFSIDSFDPRATYEFNFGNGVTKVAQQKDLAYAYTAPGTYEVELKVTFEGETEIAYSEILSIR